MGWSEKYKKSIDCDNPKGFSQRAHCQGRKKKMKEETLDYMSEGDFWHPDPEDNFGFTENWEFFSDSKEYSPTRQTDI